MIDGLGKTWHFDRERDELFTKRFPTDGFGHVGDFARVAAGGRVPG
jgi:hypothetical protein